MEERVIWLIVIIGVLIIIALVMFIAGKLRDLRTDNNAIRERERERIEQGQRLRQSLQVLCRSMLDEQVEISEGSMRVKVLIDHYDARLHHDPTLKVFNEIYNELEHMPRFDARKEHDKRTLFALDQKRYQVEQAFESRVLDASRLLIEKVS